MRTTSVLTTLLLALAVTASPGCNNTRNLRRSSQGIVTIKNLPPAPEPSLVEPPPTIWALEVQNAKGSIDVSVDPSVVRPVIWVNAPELSDRTDPANWVAAESIDDNGAHLLRVSAASPENLAFTTYLRITLPASSGVKIRSAGGPISLAGVAGPIDIENGGAMGPGAPVTLKTTAPLNAGVRVVTSAGDARVFCGQASTGKVDVRGNKVNFQPPTGAALKGVKQDSRNLSAQVGETDLPFEVQTLQGLADVRLNQGKTRN